MNGLIFLSSGDFTLHQGTKGPIMCTSIPDLSLILFYSTKCEYCHDFLEAWRRLPGSLAGCQYGICNVGKNKGAILMSKETIAPIEFVPYVLLYINGKPYMNYQGSPAIKDILDFVKEVNQNYLQTKANIQRVERRNANNGGVSASKQGGTSRKKEENRDDSEQASGRGCTTGVPIYGDYWNPDNACYLTQEQLFDN
jgi:hypothetical protein